MNHELVGVGAICAALVGCASVDSKGDRAEGFSAQALKGATVFEGNCARCHGVLGQGEGGEGPKLVGLGNGALPFDPPPGAKKRTMQFRTVGDVARFVMKNMPGDEPGTLTETDYFRVIAFDLRANGIDLDQHLDMAYADTIVIARPGDAPPAVSVRDPSHP